MNFLGNPIAEEKGDAFKNEVLIIFNDKLVSIKEIN